MEKRNENSSVAGKKKREYREKGSVVGRKE
jgi:hypothetical protein